MQKKEYNLKNGEYLFCDVNPENKVLYLQTLCNRYGDFRVFRTHRNNNNEIKFSRWRSVLECWESKEGLKWLKTVNNREILPIEIVLDIDENVNIDRVNRICDKLEKYGVHHTAYFSGSKGYHIHILSYKLGEYTKRQREMIRTVILEKLNCDPQKKSEHGTIAIECCPHWRTGRKKSVVRYFDGD